MVYSNMYNIIQLGFKTVILHLALDVDGYVTVWVQNELNAGSFESKRFDHKQTEKFFKHLSTCGVSNTKALEVYNGDLKYAFHDTVYAKDLKHLAKEVYLNGVYTLHLDDGNTLTNGAIHPA